MGWFSRGPGAKGARGKKAPASNAAIGRAGGEKGGANRLEERGRAGGRTGRQLLGGGGAPEVHRSLGLAALFAGIAGRPRLQVLDLGSAVGTNIEFMSRYGCKLYIEDFYAALITGLAGGGGERLGPAFLAHFLAFPEGTRFDAVLAWDLFNYMDRKELAALGAYLAPYCQPGAQLLALISIAKQIPQQPHRFKIVDAGHLVYERQSAAERPCPRYASAELSGLMRGFRLDRSYLMRHGVQEHLFVRRPE